MSKKEQNKYLASLKEYRDWYAVLDTAENKGYEKAQEEIEKALKREKKAQKEKEKAQKEKEKAQKEKQEALIKIEQTVLKMFNKGLSIDEIINFVSLTKKEIERIIDKNK